MTEIAPAVRAQLIIRKAVVKAARIPWFAEDPFRLLAVMQAVSADTLAAMADQTGVFDDPRIRADMIAGFARISRHEAVEAFVRLAAAKAEAEAKG